MSAKVITNLIAVRGDTIISPQWMITNEALPSNITKAELDQGLADGTYTLMDLSQYTMRGMMRLSASGAKLLDLTVDVADNKLSFIIDADVTEELPNERQVYVYDIEFTETSTGIVTTWIAGSLTLTADVTHSDTGVVA